jgi:hypothetical protein
MFSRFAVSLQGIHSTEWKTGGIFCYSNTLCCLLCTSDWCSKFTERKGSVDILPINPYTQAAHWHACDHGRIHTFFAALRNGEGGIPMVVLHTVSLPVATLLVQCSRAAQPLSRHCAGMYWSIKNKQRTFYIINQTMYHIWCPCDTD